MYQLPILRKQQGLLASFEVLEMSEKAGGTDILTEDSYLKMEYSTPLSLKMVGDAGSAGCEVQRGRLGENNK